MILSWLSSKHIISWARVNKYLYDDIPDIPRPTMDYTKSYTGSQRGFDEGLTIRKIYNSIGYFFWKNLSMKVEISCYTCLEVSISWSVDFLLYVHY